MIPKELYYTKDHEWVKVADEGLYVGITHYAQEQLGDIVYVELPEIGDSFDAGATICVVESVKTASDIYAPVAGIIKSINDALEDEPELINVDCYQNYIFVLDSPSPDLSRLLDAEAYAALIEGK